MVCLLIVEDHVDIVAIELADAELAERFGLTARNHVDEVMRKLDASTRGRVAPILRPTRASSA